uniref:CKLF like MARVEL transmembrane domain containing 3 n=1 Tax=Steinernema glaseri TaxID=37863 RepID=A0A1I7XZV3_9BILA
MRRTLVSFVRRTRTSGELQTSLDRRKDSLSHLSVAQTEDGLGLRQKLCAICERLSSPICRYFSLKQFASSVMGLIAFLFLAFLIAFYVGFTMGYLDFLMDPPAKKSKQKRRSSSKRQ